MSPEAWGGLITGGLTIVLTVWLSASKTRSDQEKQTGKLETILASVTTSIDAMKIAAEHSAKTNQREHELLQRSDETLANKLRADRKTFHDSLMDQQRRLTVVETRVQGHSDQLQRLDDRRPGPRPDERRERT